MSHDPKKKPRQPKKISIYNKVTSEKEEEKPISEQDRVRAIFMESAYVEWTPFAEKMKWDPMASRINYPVSQWVHEKKKLIAQKEAEHITQLIFEHKGRWHREVLKTLRDYPKAIDTLFAIANAKIGGMAQEAKDDMNFPLPDGSKRLDKYKPSDFMMMSSALKNLTDTKYKSLMLHDWNVRTAEQEANTESLSRNVGDEDQGNWIIEIKGGDKIKGKEFESVIAEFYDKPIPVISMDNISSPVEEEDA